MKSQCISLTLPCPPPPPGPAGWNFLSSWTGYGIPSYEVGAEALAASSWSYHPQYSSTRVRNDIGIVFLAQPSAKQPVFLDFNAASGFAAPGRGVVALGVCPSQGPVFSSLPRHHHASDD